MNIFIDHWGSWLFLVSLIVFGIYSMQTIKEEAQTFLDDSYLVTFAELSLPIPRWWTQVSSEAHQIRFERTDTRYDWYAVFQWYGEESSDLALENVLANYLEKEEIQYDQHEIQIQTDSRHLIKDPDTANYFTEFIRLEGTATQKSVERIYYDIIITRPNKGGGYFLFESKSSVLNGSLEGPFFEECLKELKLS